MLFLGYGMGASEFSQKNPLIRYVSLIPQTMLLYPNIASSFL